MVQDIVCHKGKCKDMGSIKSKFEEVYDQTDVETKIEMDMFKKSINSRSR